MATKISSRKAKGRKFQQEIVTNLRTLYSLDSLVESYYEGDVQARLMGGAGTDVVLSPKAQTLIPFDVEIKNQQRWNIPDWWKQTRANTKENRTPLLIMKRNRHEPLAVISWKDLQELLKKIYS